MLAQSPSVDRLEALADRVELAIWWAKVAAIAAVAVLLILFLPWLLAGLGVRPLP